MTAMRTNSTLPWNTGVPRRASTLGGVHSERLAVGYNYQSYSELMYMSCYTGRRQTNMGTMTSRS